MIGKEKYVSMSLSEFDRTIKIEEDNRLLREKIGQMEKGMWELRYENSCLKEDISMDVSKYRILLDYFYTDYNRDVRAIIRRYEKLIEQFGGEENLKNVDPQIVSVQNMVETLQKEANKLRRIENDRKHRG